MLEKIFDQWADAMGGLKRLRAVQSISKRGRFYGFESQGEILEWAVPGCYRSHYTLEMGMNALLVINGKQGWSKQNGRVTPLAGFEMLLQKTRLWFETFALLLPELNEAPMHFDGKSPDDSAWLVGVDLMEGLVCQVLVNCKNHLPQEYICRLGIQVRHVRFEDWRRIKGLTLPFCTTDYLEPTGDELRAEYDEILIDVPLMEGLFDCPADEASAR